MNCKVSYQGYHFEYVDVINRTAIEQAITQFRKMGATDWQATNSVPRERFPIVSEKEALAAMIGTG